MSGILDNKSRVLDTIMTLEGRRQLSQGGIDVSYVSFSDSMTFYAADVASGSQDATQRIYLESCQLPQDQITFQADDAGNVQPFGNTVGIAQANGKIVSYAYTATSGTVVGGNQATSASQGDVFAGAADQLLASSIGNFNRLRVIATHDNVFEDDGFAVGPNQLTFALNNDRPIKDPTQYTVNLSSLDSIFGDPRFSNLPNFRYLPPINRTTDATIDLTDSASTSQLQLASYVPWGRTQLAGLSYQQIKHELGYYEQLGYMRQLSFDPTSLRNTLVGQFFEKNFNTLQKLDVVDYGIHRTGNPSASTAHIFFVGKVKVDDKGTDTFLHLFTLVFE